MSRGRADKGVIIAAPCGLFVDRGAASRAAAAAVPLSCLSAQSDRLGQLAAGVNLNLPVNRKL